MCVAKIVVETKKISERGHQQMELVKDSVMLCDPATGPTLINYSSYLNLLDKEKIRLNQVQQLSESSSKSSTATI